MSPLSSNPFMCLPFPPFTPICNYENNLHLLLTNFTSSAGKNKFYNLTSGESPNKVYGLFLCNGLTINQVCLDCITIAAAEIRLRCPASVEAIVWYSHCMLRYANRSIFSISDVSVYHNFQAGPAKYTQFNQQLSEAFINLFNKDNTINSPLRSSIRSVYVTKDIVASCYVDCTPDISALDCNKCLQTGLGRLEFDGSLSRVLVQPSCRLMFSAGKKEYIILGVISAATVASLAFNVFACLQRRRTNGNPTGNEKIRVDLDTVDTWPLNMQQQDKLQ